MMRVVLGGEAMLGIGTMLLHGGSLIIVGGGGLIKLPVSIIFSPIGLLSRLKGGGRRICGVTN